MQRRTISTFEPLGDRGIGVMVDVAESEAFGELTRLVWAVAAGVFAIMAIAAVPIWAVASRLASSERQLESLHEAAQLQSLSDALTGLANRRAFDEYIERVVAQARDAGAVLSVTMLDLNRFKRLNDTRGHAAGDAALRAIGNEIRMSIRQEDFAARLGGDEFAVVHPDCGEATAASVAARIADAVQRLGIICDLDNGTLLTVTAGTATLTTQETVSELLAEADVNLYRAKDHGRRAVTIPTLGNVTQ